MARDVLGCAQTGTGKTASFTLPMLDILSEGRAKARMPRSLILSPTRELASQIADNFKTYSKYQSLSMALLIGGTNMGDQIKALQKGVDVLIATPGRLLDMFDRGNILASDMKMLVIDEADRMLDMGFMPDVERIVSLLPKMRQTLMFSATMAKEIRRLADVFLANPKEITVSAPQSTATTVAQHLVWVGSRNKRRALRALLSEEQVQTAFIFCNRKKDVAILNKSLQRHGFQAEEMHGDLTQAERMSTLERFKAGEISLLVCSDVAARGIDVSDISHVFNFDIPINAEDYVHRIGRTGRAGKEGRAFSFATKDDTKLVDAVEKAIDKSIDGLAVEDVGFPNFDALSNADTQGSEDRASRTKGGKKAPTSSSRTDNKSKRRGKDNPDDSAAPSRRSSGRRNQSYDQGPAEPAPSVETLRQSLPDELIAADEDAFLKACDAFERRVPAFMLRGMKPIKRTPVAVDA